MSDNNCGECGWDYRDKRHQEACAGVIRIIESDAHETCRATISRLSERVAELEGHVHLLREAIHDNMPFTHDDLNAIRVGLCNALDATEPLAATPAPPTAEETV